MVLTSPERRILPSAVINGAPWAKAVAAMMRSKGSLGKVEGNSAAILPICAVSGSTLKFVSIRSVNEESGECVRILPRTTARAIS